MKRRIATALVATALVASSFGVATTAQATPGRNRACSACHKINPSVQLSIKKVKSTSTKTIYKVTVSGGRGASGLAVFLGSKNIAHGSGTSKMFTLKRHKTYTVRGVMKGTGSAAKKLVVK